MKKHVKTLLLAVGLLCNVFCVTYVRAADDYYVVAYVTSWSQGLPDPSRLADFMLKYYPGFDTPAGRRKKNA